MFNIGKIPADLSHPNSERFNVKWPLEKVSRNGETSSSLAGRTSGLPKPSYVPVTTAPSSRDNKIFENADGLIVTAGNSHPCLAPFFLLFSACRPPAPKSGETGRVS